MDFDLGEKEKELIRKVEALFEEEAGGSFSARGDEDAAQMRNRLVSRFKRLGETGYLSLGIDDRKNSVPLLAVQECLASLSPGLFMAAETGARIFGRLLSAFGGPDLKDEILPPLKRGELIGSLKISDKEIRWTRAGDRILISGSVPPAINAPFADWIALSSPVEGPGFFLINRGAENLFFGPTTTRFARDTAAYAPIRLDGCPVPPGRLIASPGSPDAVGAVRLWEDQGLTAAALGIMKRSFDSALLHAKGHRLAGRPLISHQEFGFKLAEMLTLLQTGRLLACRAAWMSEVGDKEATVLAHCAKVFCAEGAEEVASQALQVLGEEALFGPHPATEGYEVAKYLQVAGNRTELARMSIADGLLEKAR